MSGSDLKSAEAKLAETSNAKTVSDLIGTDAGRTAVMRAGYYQKHPSDEAIVFANVRVTQPATTSARTNANTNENASANASATRATAGATDASTNAFVSRAENPAARTASVIGGTATTVDMTLWRGAGGAGGVAVTLRLDSLFDDADEGARSLLRSKHAWSGSLWRLAAANRASSNELHLLLRGRGQLFGRHAISGQLALVLLGREIAQLALSGDVHGIGALRVERLERAKWRFVARLDVARLAAGLRLLTGAESLSVLAGEAKAAGSASESDNDGVASTAASMGGELLQALPEWPAIDGPAVRVVVLRADAPSAERGHGGSDDSTAWTVALSLPLASAEQRHRTRSWLGQDGRLPLCDLLLDRVSVTRIDAALMVAHRASDKKRDVRLQLRAQMRTARVELVLARDRSTLRLAWTPISEAMRLVHGSSSDSADRRFCNWLSRALRHVSVEGSLVLIHMPKSSLELYLKAVLGGGLNIGPFVVSGEIGAEIWIGKPKSVADKIENYEDGNGKMAGVMRFGAHGVVSIVLPCFRTQLQLHVHFCVGPDKVDGQNELEMRFQASGTVAFAALKEVAGGKDAFDDKSTLGLSTFEPTGSSAALRCTVVSAPSERSFTCSVGWERSGEIDDCWPRSATVGYEYEWKRDKGGDSKHQFYVEGKECDVIGMLKELFLCIFGKRRSKPVMARKAYDVKLFVNSEGVVGVQVAKVVTRSNQNAALPDKAVASNSSARRGGNEFRFELSYSPSEPWDFGCDICVNSFSFADVLEIFVPGAEFLANRDVRKIFEAVFYVKGVVVFKERVRAYLKSLAKDALKSSAAAVAEGALKDTPYKGVAKLIGAAGQADWRDFVRLEIESLGLFRFSDNWTLLGADDALLLVRARADVKRLAFELQVGIKLKSNLGKLLNLAVELHLVTRLAIGNSSENSEFSFMLKGTLQFVQVFSCGVQCGMIVSAKRYGFLIAFEFRVLILLHVRAALLLFWSEKDKVMLIQVRMGFFEIDSKVNDGTEFKELQWPNGNVNHKSGTNSENIDESKQMEQARKSAKERVKQEARSFWESIWGAIKEWVFPVTVKVWGEAKISNDDTYFEGKAFVRVFKLKKTYKWKVPDEVDSGELRSDIKREVDAASKDIKGKSRAEVAKRLGCEESDLPDDFEAPPATEWWDKYVDRCLASGRLASIECKGNSLEDAAAKMTEELKEKQWGATDWEILQPRRSGVDSTVTLLRVMLQYRVKDGSKLRNGELVDGLLKNIDVKAVVIEDTTRVGVTIQQVATTLFEKQGRLCDTARELATKEAFCDNCKHKDWDYEVIVARGGAEVRFAIQARQCTVLRSAGETLTSATKSVTRGGIDPFSSLTLIATGVIDTKESLNKARQSVVNDFLNSDDLSSKDKNSLSEFVAGIGRRINVREWTFTSDWTALLDRVWRGEGDWPVIASERQFFPRFNYIHKIQDGVEVDESAWHDLAAPDLHVAAVEFVKGACKHPVVKKVLEVERRDGREGVEQRFGRFLLYHFMAFNEKELGARDAQWNGFSGAIDQLEKVVSIAVAAELVLLISNVVEMTPHDLSPWKTECLEWSSTATLLKECGVFEGDARWLWIALLERWVTTRSHDSLRKMTSDAVEGALELVQKYPFLQSFVSTSVRQAPSAVDAMRQWIADNSIAQIQRYAKMLALAVLDGPNLESMWPAGGDAPEAVDIGVPMLKAATEALVGRDTVQHCVPEAKDTERWQAGAALRRELAADKEAKVANQVLGTVIESGADEAGTPIERRGNTVPMTAEEAERNEQQRQRMLSSKLTGLGPLDRSLLSSVAEQSDDSDDDSDDDFDAEVRENMRLLLESRMASNALASRRLQRMGARHRNDRAEQFLPLDAELSRTGALVVALLWSADAGDEREVARGQTLTLLFNTVRRVCAYRRWCFVLDTSTEHAPTLVTIGPKANRAQVARWLVAQTCNGNVLCDLTPPEILALVCDELDKRDLLAAHASSSDVLIISNDRRQILSGGGEEDGALHVHGVLLGDPAVPDDEKMWRGFTSFTNIL